MQVAAVFWRVSPVGAFLLGASGSVAAQGIDHLFAPEVTQAAEDARVADYAQIPLTDAERERREVWDSPEMVAARAWLLQYFQSTERYDEATAQAYLRALERLDADSLRIWLAQLEATRRRAAERRLAAQAEQRRDVATGLRFHQAQSAAYQAQQQRLQGQQLRNFQQRAQQEAARARAAEERLSVQRLRSQDQLLRDAAAQEARRLSLGRVYRTLEFLDRQQLRDDVRAIREAIDAEN